MTHSTTHSDNKTFGSHSLCQQNIGASDTHSQSSYDSDVMSVAAIWAQAFSLERELCKAEGHILMHFLISISANRNHTFAISRVTRYHSGHVHIGKKKQEGTEFDYFRKKVT